MAALVVVPAPGAGAQTTCFGMTPTILAVSGVVTLGTSGDDVILGTPGRDTIRSLGGDDRVCSRGGADIVEAGHGDDRIDLGGGRDVARAGPGADRVLGRGGKDRIWGNGGADDLRGGRGIDRIVGGAGPDTIDGGNGGDKIFGSRGRDRLDGGKGDDTIRGGSGNDALWGRSGSDELVGGSGTDACVGGPDPDQVSGCESANPPSLVPVPTPTPTPKPTGTPLPQPTPTTPPVDPAPTPTAPPADPTATPTATPTPTATATPAPPTPVQQLVQYVNDEIIDVYTGHPWLATAWTWVQANGTVEVDDIGPPIAGQVRVTCSAGTGNLGSCGDTVYTIDDQFIASVNTNIHELAHVYELSTGVLADPGPLGMAQLYFMIEWGHVSCSPSEVFADTLLHITKPDASLAYYAFACSGLPSEPTAAAEAVITAMLAGNDSAWFASSYANGAEAWADVMTLSFTDKARVVQNLRNEFGGYCSVDETVNAAYGTQPVANPWQDGGCP